MTAVSAFATAGARSRAARAEPTTPAALLQRDSHSHPTSTATNAEAQTASPSTTNSVQLPNTTIVALGMGFIAAALVVILFTVLIRVNTVLRAARRARRNGEDITFQDMWERWGGWWGLLFANNGSGNNETVIVRRKRLKPIPKMWDVDMDKLQPKDEFDLADEAAQPLAAAPYYAPGETVPEIAFSVLVMMPSQPQEGPLEDIPDVMLGTTHLKPTVPLADAGLQQQADDDPDKAEVTELEFIHTTAPRLPLRRTSQPHWVMAWGIDGGRIA